MGQRLILDTNILIAYERGTVDCAALDEDELAIASVSVAEYRVGIEMADTAERARALTQLHQQLTFLTTRRRPRLMCADRVLRVALMT